LAATTIAHVIWSFGDNLELGDKAAEMTAMAQQFVGGYVPPAVPSGLA